MQEQVSDFSVKFGADLTIEKEFRPIMIVSLDGKEIVFTADHQLPDEKSVRILVDTIFKAIRKPTLEIEAGPGSSL